MELRENQIEPTRIGIEFFQQVKSVPSIIVAPTAFGKSIVIAKIAESVKDNLLILQPSKELLSQNYEKYVSLGGRAHVYSASFNSKRIGAVTFATIGSIVKIGRRFKEMEFSKMVIDECHLFPRNSDSMIGRFLKESEIPHVLGLTATPLKLQSNVDQYGNPFSKLVMLTANSKKGKFFKEIISVSQIQDIVKLGFWAKLEYEQYVMDETGLRYNSTKADFTEESLKKVYESNNMPAKIIQKLIDMKDRKSIIVFVPSVADAISLSRQVPGSAAIYSGMPDKERVRAVTGFKNLTIRTIFNVNILSVGFDHPQLDGIIMARPTASLTWLYQALGRGTRIHPLKKDCLIVDFSGNIKRFGRIEHLHFVKEGSLWKLYGEFDNLLSGVPLHEIGMYKKNPIPAQATPNGEYTMKFGKHIGQPVSMVPLSYRQWMLGSFDWNERNKDLKEALEKSLSKVA